MTSGVDDAERPVDNNLLHELRADARIEFIDNVHQQQAELQRLRPPPSSNGSAGFASASSASAWDVPSPTPLRHKACAVSCGLPTSMTWSYRI
jgi:hypothetical protein